MSKEQTQFAFPAAWCSRTCKNAMSEICVTQCAISRNCSGFEEKEGLTLIDLPTHMPDPQTLSREEKFHVLYLYTSKLNDNLRGVEQSEPRPFPRPRTNSKTGSGISPNIEGEGIQHDSQTEITIYQTGEERTREDVPVDEVVRGTD